MDPDCQHPADPASPCDRCNRAREVTRLRTVAERQATSRGGRWRIDTRDGGGCALVVLAIVAIYAAVAVLLWWAFQ